MRADRLVAALLLLQARGRVTAAALAAELEVSVPTARRDLEALSAAGIPVYSQPGRGGGWSLVGGARTDLSGLTAHEAQALFLLVGPAAAVDGEARSALRKLLRALPQTFRDDAQAAAASVVIDPSRWGERVRPPRPALVATLQSAVVRRSRVRLRYAGRAGPVTERAVDPWGLVEKDDVWYLLAGTAARRRTFRVDRVLGVTVTETAAERPDDLELAAEWQDVVETVEERRAGVSTTVLLAARFVPVLETQFGRQCEVGEALPDGRVEVTVSAPTPLMIAQQLAGWGALVEIAPDWPDGVGGGTDLVGVELARLGSELVARYATREDEASLHAGGRVQRLSGPPSTPP